MSYPDLCDLEYPSALAPPQSAPFHWGAFEGHHYSSRKGATYLHVILHHLYMLAYCQPVGCCPQSLYPFTPFPCPPQGSSGGLSPLDIALPVSRPPPHPTVMFLLLLFLSPQPPRPKLGLLWHGFPDWSLLWLILSSHSAGLKSTTKCEVLWNHGAASTMRVKMGPPWAEVQLGLGEEEGRFHMEKTACADPPEASCP